MFDLLGIFFQKLGAVIGGTFIAIGGVLGGSAPSIPPIELAPLTEAPQTSTSSDTSSMESLVPEVAPVEEKIKPAIIASKQISPTPSVPKVTEIVTPVPPPIVSEPVTTPKEEIITPPSAGPSFKVNRASGTVYDGYGSYGLYLTVTAGDKDVLIPKATSNSQEKVIGFFYTVEGAEFRGDQDSDVECGRVADGYCKIVAGKTSQITVTVWLTPSAPGNYAVNFTKMLYTIAGEPGMKTFTVNEEAGPLFLQ